MTDLADIVAGRLASWPRKTIRVEEIECLIVEERPELAADASRGARVAAVFESLVSMGLGAPSRRTVVRFGVRTPTLLTLIPRSVPHETDQTAEWPWVEGLRWVASPGARQLRPVLISRLKRLNTWLAGHPDEEPAPERERSLEVFDDDKLLGELLRGVLRGREPPGLRTYPVSPPMLLEPTGSNESSVLIVENHTTWHSLLSVAREGQRSSIGWIGFGVGNQAAWLVASLRSISPERISYFGDLDWSGLEIAADAARAASGVGLSAIRPHYRLYEMLLELGRPQSRKTERRGWPNRGLEWCGPELASLLTSTLAGDQWLAQEWVGHSALRRDRSWDRL